MDDYTGESTPKPTEPQTLSETPKSFTMNPLVEGWIDNHLDERQQLLAADQERQAAPSDIEHPSDTDPIEEIRLARERELESDTIEKSPDDILSMIKKLSQIYHQTDLEQYPSAKECIAILTTSYILQAVDLKIDIEAIKFAQKSQEPLNTKINFQNINQLAHGIFNEWFPNRIGTNPDLDEKGNLLLAIAGSHVIIEDIQDHKSIDSAKELYYFAKAQELILLKQAKKKNISIENNDLKGLIKNYEEFFPFKPKILSKSPNFAVGEVRINQILTAIEQESTLY